ncbi:MAG: hypothetical protein JNL80_17170 [Phycisphaerae bacterium]|jgi:uncharacterized protein (TIGR01244 family)|nr:hypothetical protein [Phycisphaerae bacterium]
MHRRPALPKLLTCSLVLVAGSVAACKGTGPSPADTAASQAATPHSAPPVAVAVSDPALSNSITNLAYSGNTYFAGFPTEAGLRELKSRGVTRIISLKTNEEVAKAKGFDEAAVAKELGIELIVIPVSAKSFRPEDVTRFRDAFEASSAPVLVHCGSSNTVGGVWAAYLSRYRGLSSGDALDAGRAAGLKSPDMTEATERVLSTPVSN